MHKKKTTNQGLLISVAVVIAFGVLIGATYYALTHRHVDALVRLDQPPSATAHHPLHKALTFRVAVATMLSPIKSYKAYGDLADLLARQYGMPAELVTRKTYAEVNGLLRDGEVDVAFVCSGGFASAPDAMDVIAAPLIDGLPEYHALIIVPSDSAVRSLEDLRGKRFLFMEPDSNTGYWYPLERLKALGETPEGFFGETQWTGSHDHSILAVSQRLAEGASVHSVVFNFMVSADEALARQLRILEKSPPYPSPPVVVRKTMPVPRRKGLVKSLVDLSKTEEGRVILRGIGIDGFVPAENAMYSSIRPPEPRP
jgi:phosphonate transport system substrate-binding protein